MEKKLNIIVLYHLGIAKSMPAFLKQHIFCLRNYFPKNRYLYHNVLLHSPENLKRLDVDALILDVTILGIRWGNRESFHQFLADYSFLADLPVIKIALPQDEYDCHLLLDNWMTDWKIDIVYSVLAKHWDVLYPRYSKAGNIELAYTGYLDETLLQYKPKPYHQRQIDIGYRARKLPPYFGKIGETKWQIGLSVDKKARELNLLTDIAVGDSATLHNQSWYDFIENCKFMLGSNSGSSLLDPTGLIQANIRNYLVTHPHANYEEIKSLFFSDQADKYSFTAISPRVLEAAMLKSCQILVKGEYSGILEPWVHYIPIEEDASNFSEVYDFMQNENAVLNMIDRCREKILSVPELQYTHHAARIIQHIKELRQSHSYRKKGYKLNAMRYTLLNFRYSITPAYLRLTLPLRNILRNIKAKFSAHWHKRPHAA